MWSGGRSLESIAVAGGLLASLGTAAGQTPLCNGQHPGNPELIAGAASCVYNEVNGAGQTLIDLNDTSIIRWDHLGLGNPQSTLTFQWSGSPAGNPSVINRVEGWNGQRPTHDISGTVQFLDGNLVVSNPNSTVHMSGTVAARSLIFATHRLAPSQEQALLDGQAAEFTGATKDLSIEDGRIVVSEGDAVLAGRNVINRSVDFPAETAPEIVTENGSVRIFAGENFRLLPNGSERLEHMPGGSVGGMSNSKGIRAAQDVEISATAAINNDAIIDARNGTRRVFLRVDDPANGQITNAETALINGFLFSSPEVTNSGVIRDDDTDSPSPLSTGISRLRIPPRPGESEDKAETVVLFENAPTTGSASAQRDRGSASSSRRSGTARVARNTGAPLARGRSFFGLRGGTRKRSEQASAGEGTGRRGR